MPEDPKQDPPPADPPAADPAAPAADPAAPPAADPPQGSAAISFKTQESFNDRMARHHASQLKKDYGVEDAGQLKTDLAELAELRAAKEEARQADLSAQEKLQEDLNKSKSRLAAVQEERDAIRFESHVKGVCAELGVTNVDYAMYAIGKASDEAAEGAQVDAKELLSGLMKSDTSRAALGMPQQAQVVADPANTSPGAVIPPTPKPPDASNSGFDANKASKEEFQKHLESKGLGLLGN
jgi:hypothetical protein